MKSSEKAFNFLKKQGYNPEWDNETSNIVFVFNGYTYLFVNNDSMDEQGFFVSQIAMPNIYGVDNKNRIKVLEACNNITFNTALLKAAVYDEETESTVWLVFENAFGDETTFTKSFTDTMELMENTYNQFYALMNE